MELESSKFYYETGLSFINNSLDENILLSLLIFFTIIAILLMTIFDYKKLRNLFIFLLLFEGIYELSIPMNTKDTVAKIIEKGDFFVAEGKITNFHEMPISGHDTEKFNIGGTHFEISYTGNYSNKKTLFYTSTKNRNGPITHDGQKVKIHYIKIGAFDLCLPFVSHCLEFNKATENKIIKMWIYD